MDKLRQNDYLKRQQIAEMWPEMHESIDDVLNFMGILLKTVDGLSRYPNDPSLYSYEADIVEAAILDGGIPPQAKTIIEPIRSGNY